MNIKEYHKWKQKEGEAYLKRKEHPELYYQIHKEEILKKKQQLKLLAETLVGRECCVCGKKVTLCFHEIHGKPHTASFQYIIKHHKDFIRLCRCCHITLHYLLNHPQLSQYLPLLIER
jgi:hypothetical protein